MHALFLIFLIFAAKASADSKTLSKEIIGQSADWTLIRANPNGNNTCYAILYPQSRTGNQKTVEEKPYIMVHYFSRHKMRFSIYFGYKLLEKRDVNMSINSIQHKLQPYHQYAIAKDARQDAQIIEKLQSGTILLIRGEGENFAYSVDSYNIAGFTEIFNTMEQKCSFHDDESSFSTITPHKKHIKEIKHK